MWIKVLEFLWTAVKSIVLLAMVGVLALVGWVLFQTQPMWAIAFFVLVIALSAAAAKAVNSRARLAAYVLKFAPCLVLLGSILVFAYGLAILSGGIAYQPALCLGPGRWICRLNSAIFQMGGSDMWAVICLLFSLVGMRLAVRDLLASRSAVKVFK